MLLMTTDTEKGGSWGVCDDPIWAPRNCGSVIVVRKDGKELKPQQLTVLADYYHEIIIPKIIETTEVVWEQGLEGKTDCNRQSLEEARKDVLEKYISRASFEEYFYVYNKQHVYDDNRWSDCVSPYDI